MKFISTQDNLTRALRTVGHLSGRSGNLPILANVLIRAAGGGVDFIATNLEIAIVVKTRAKVEVAGNYTVNTALLASTIELLPKTNIEITLKQDNVVVKADDQEVKMRGVEASEFPIIPEIQGDPVARLTIKDFRSALDGVTFAIAVNEVRPEISGAVFRFAGDQLTLAGTDSYRLAESGIKLTVPATTDRKIIIPLRTLQELLRIASGAEVDLEAKIFLSEGQVRFDFGEEVSLTSRLIEGSFPAYEQIIPTKYKTRAVIDREELLRATKRAALFCSPGMADVTVQLTPGKSEDAGVVAVKSQNVQIGEAHAQLQAAVAGEENRIVFNARYLIDGLSHLATPEVALEVISDTSPGVLRPSGANAPAYLYLIMPIKTA